MNCWTHTTVAGHNCGVHSLPQQAVTAEAIILIISADTGERERLRCLLPPDVRVQLAATEGEALGLLRSAVGSHGREVDVIASGVRLQPDGLLTGAAEVRLTPLEHAMLGCLLSPPGSVWSLLALSERVWGTSFVGDGCQVRAVLKRLRRKLLTAGADLRIESVRGRGLRLVVGAEMNSENAQQMSQNCPMPPIAGRI